MLDAGMAETRIGMSSAELTEEGVFAAIAAELPPDLAARTRLYLLETRCPSGSR